MTGRHRVARHRFEVVDVTGSHPRPRPRARVDYTRRPPRDNTRRRQQHVTLVVLLGVLLMLVAVVNISYLPAVFGGVLIVAGVLLDRTPGHKLHAQRAKY